MLRVKSVIKAILANNLKFSNDHTLQFGGIRVGNQETLSAVPVNWSIESRKKNNGCIGVAYVNKCLKWAVNGTKSSGMFSKGSIKL